MEWTTTSGFKPFQPQRVGEALGARTDRPSSEDPLEDYQDGGNRSRGRGKSNGRLYKVHETLLSHRDEALEDVEGGRELSKFLVVFLGLTRLCQEIGLVAFMFFFELLFSYVSSSISFYVSLTNLFSIILFPYLLITRDTQDEGEARFDSTDTGNSLK